VKKAWDGVGEEEAGEVEAGLDLGLEEGRSVTYRLGRGLVGCSASVEDLDEDLDEDLADGGAILIVHGFAHVFLGFRDGGGPIQDTRIGRHTRPTAGDMVTPA